MSFESVEYSLHGPVELLHGITGIVLPADIANRTEGSSADDILRLFADILLANGTESLTVREHREHFGSERSLRLTQSIRGIPVLEGGVSFSYDSATRQVTGVAAHFVPDRDLPRRPRLTAKQAEQVVPKALAIAERIKASGVQIMDGTHLGYYAEQVQPGAGATCLGRRNRRQLGERAVLRGCHDRHRRESPAPEHILCSPQSSAD